MFNELGYRVWSLISHPLPSYYINIVVIKIETGILVGIPTAVTKIIGMCYSGSSHRRIIVIDALHDCKTLWCVHAEGAIVLHESVSKASED